MRSEEQYAAGFAVTYPPRPEPIRCANGLGCTGPPTSDEGLCAKHHARQAERAAAHQLETQIAAAARRTAKPKAASNAAPRGPRPSIPAPKPPAHRGHPAAPPAPTRPTTRGGHVLQCALGHTWTRPGKHKSEPSPYCPQHRTCTVTGCTNRAPAGTTCGTHRKAAQRARTPLSETRTAQCKAGHDWEAPRQAGRPSAWCPDHKSTAPERYYIQVTGGTVEVTIHLPRRHLLTPDDAAWLTALRDLIDTRKATPIGGAG